MATIYGIITRGYFPKELPPPFTSKIYGSILSKHLSTLPSGFADRDKISKNLKHNLLVRGNIRRRLGVPNPTNFFRLTRFISNNWGELVNITSQSHISTTTPVFTRRPRAIEGKCSYADRDHRRAYVRSKSRYIFKADINQFYHSIYTHSIPWAIHGKSAAKAKKHDNKLLGNALDRLLRNSQDGQTIGIPIGPDTSLLIAEIILSAIDNVLPDKEMKNAFRIIDDYEFGCDSLVEAESIKETLQETLSEYGLTLNPNPPKTDIIQLPVPIESLCISQLRTYSFSTANTVRQKNEVIYYFDQAFNFSRECPDVAVLKYAVIRFGGVKVAIENWSLCVNLLLQCAIVEPSTIEAVLNQILLYKEKGFNLDIQNIGEVFNRIIARHAPLGHGSEVAWALWGLMVLDISVSDENAEKAAVMSDSIVALLMLDAKAKRLVSSSIDFSHFQSYMYTEELYGEQWLLAYEANIKNWLQSNTRSDHVDKDNYFSFLKTKGVYFYDDTLSGRTKYRPKKPTTGGEPY